MLKLAASLRGGLVAVACAWLAGCGVEAADAESESIDTVGQALVSCSGIQPWVSQAYAPGARVQSQGSVYQCKDWPASGWCQQYEPGVTWAWADAWTLIDGCLPCGPVINEAETNRSSNPSDDFVELANTCDTPYSLAGHKLYYRSAAGTFDVLVMNLDAYTLPARGYLWFHGVQYTGDRSTANGGFGAALSATGGGLAIRSATGEVLDAFGYGTATNFYIEGTRAAASTRGSSMSRLPGMIDTENNSADIHAAPATPSSDNL